MLLFFERQKKRSKQLVLGLGVQFFFLLSSRTPLGYSLTSCPGQESFFQPSSKL